ncbi:hypothetical protein NG895_18335 [Aeoliella sp. ICT_H6.2]|uniref:Uncharacterized protein n=1 Tax=Aeoliella straminimaris TaxID=2954799 RepID=A0A9X2FD27_9BACT|nr:hypothetical protein [Aeoliella straminimaris]MCO6045862.1 hypothetical protein [Aeoliella straminimaris]
MFKRTILCCVALTFLSTLLPADRARAESSYGQAYQKMWGTNPNMVNDTNRYLYDKYYRDNPNISPYISGAVLGGNMYGDAYSTVVRPDMERRAASQSAQSRYIADRKLQGNIGYTANPGVTPQNAPSSYQYGKPVPAGRKNSGAYQNHWYGSWNK